MILFFLYTHWQDQKLQTHCIGQNIGRQALRCIGSRVDSYSFNECNVVIPATISNAHTFNQQYHFKLSILMIILHMCKMLCSLVDSKCLSKDTNVEDGCGWELKRSLCYPSIIQTLIQFQKYVISLWKRTRCIMFI